MLASVAVGVHHVGPVEYCMLLDWLAKILRLTELIPTIGVYNLVELCQFATSERLDLVRSCTPATSENFRFIIGTIALAFLCH
jgi:hypothetical protein